jgi:thiol:disulfide interchange protein
MRNLQLVLFAALLLCLSCWGNSARAQAPDFTGQLPGYGEATVKLGVSPAGPYKVGDVITLTFDAHVVQDGWHLYSSRTDGNIAYNATELFIFEDESQGIKKAGAMTENRKPREREDELMGGTIRDFAEHDVKFTQKLKVTSAKVHLVGEFVYQFCTDAGMCKFPKLPFEWSFTATGPGGDSSDDEGLDGNGGKDPQAQVTPVPNPDSAAQAAAAAKADSARPAADTTAFGDFQVFGPGKSAAVKASEGEEDCSGSALFSMFILAFLGGLGAILTPCVFPMIPMTVSFFLKQGEGEVDRAAGIRGGAIYAASIIFIYAGLGLFISTVFGPSALYTLGSHWIPNLIFFLIFLIFAMSFLGMFEIVLPSSWSTAMNNKASKGGFFGPFFMALTLVIVSFSCTGPILGAAVVGSTQGAVCTWKPFMAFLGFGVAFGIPFGLLAAFPKLMQKLPMAGGWMNTVKVVFGFLELALCMKFLSNIDLALHLHILDRQVFLGIWIVIFGLLGAYFLGWITMPHDDKTDRVSVPRLLMAVASMSFALYLVPGLWGGPLTSLEGLAPPMNKNIGVRLQPHVLEDGEGTLNEAICKSDRKYADIMQDREAHGFCMFYDLEQAVLFAREKNRPIFVDFTGHSCANCRAMENSVWTDNKVHQLLTEEFVMVSLYADEPFRFKEPLINPEGKKLRTVGDLVQYYQARNFGVVSQPYYVLMDHDQQPLNTPVPYTPVIEEYVKFLEEGIKIFNEKHEL